MFHIVQNQLNLYITALPYLMTYVMSALSSDTYVEPAAKQYCNMVFFTVYACYYFSNKTHHIVGYTAFLFTLILIVI